ncbi:uncharacterized protein N7518_005379 [Penicillium psychrosexuale]|uniref:uncharacterized protein n=1 Tax=Penicillium psychrosexuale TaxID=1002107 RepID=UPI00254583BC|nr:uncharacterized protein N7518_005379 [Penicillium psychrosexuale]KAJ5796839.1 hypothetical protein N7518_005379 [Penicillium psychrosexuale]
MNTGPNHPIKWGTYREGVLSQLQRFESLPQDGLKLMESYQAVLDNDETFTQYFSDKPLESYTIETRLRETLGIRPPRQNNPSISWVNIFRHGSFEMQSDGSYHCYDEGKLVEIDKSLHKCILLNRCFLPTNSYLWPSPADAEREAEVTLAIEADILDEIDKKIKYVEKLKRLQLALKKRRNKLQGIRDPTKRSRTPQTPAQYPTPNESRRPTVSVETRDARARSSSESSGISSGSDIPFAVSGDNSRPLSYDRDDAAGSSGQEHSNPIDLAEGNQNAHDNKMGVSVARRRSNRNPEVAPIQHDKQKSKQSQGDESPKHQLDDNEDLVQPPPKKQKFETEPLPTDIVQTDIIPTDIVPTDIVPTDIETIDLSEELPMWKGKVDTPTKLQPKSSTGKRIGQKRTRNNFTDYEKKHAPAWFKSQIDAGRLPADVEKAYVEKFGVFHRFLTVKLWVDRMEERAGRAQPPSKIVVLKVQLPLQLHMAFLNDNSS